MRLIGRGDKPRDRWLSADYHTSLSTGMPENRRPPQTAPQITPGLPGKPQNTVEHTAEHGRCGSKHAEQQCMLNYRR